MANRALKKLRQAQRHVEAFLKRKGVLFEGTTPLSSGLRVIQFCGHVYHGFIENRAPVRAAALAYTTVLALVPMLAIVISISTSLLKKERDTTIPLLIERFVASVAPMLAAGSGAEGSASGAGQPTVEILDLKTLAERLKSHSDPVSQHLWSKLSSTIRQTLSQFDGSHSATVALRKAMVIELDQLIRNESLYDTNRLAGIELSPETQSLAGQKSDEETRVRLNLLLLEETFPQEISRSRINRQDVVGRLQDYVDNVIDYIDEVKSGTLGVTAVLVLVFIAISLLSTIESTFNDIWAVPRGRTWLSRVISYWAGLTLGPLLLLTALGLTSAGQFEIVREWLEKVEIIGIFIFRFLIPFLILSLGFSALYLLLPNTKVDWRAAIVGGTVAGCLLQLNSLCSVVYGSRAVTYSKIYGSLAVVPLFLVGLYLSWTIILLGAQVAYVFQFRNENLEDEHAESVHQRARELAALELMTGIGRQFQSGDAPLTASAISQALNLPFKLASQILTLLAKNQLLLEITGPEPTYSPARPLETIRSQDILRAVRIGDGRELPPNPSRTHQLARTELEAIESAEAQRSGSVTLKDLVEQTLQS